MGPYPHYVIEYTDVNVGKVLWETRCDNIYEARSKVLELKDKFPERNFGYAPLADTETFFQYSIGSSVTIH